MKNDTRYFTVYFSGIDDDNVLRKGKIQMFVEDGGYVNEAFVHEAIINDFGLDFPYISGITELSKDDWDDYLSGKSENDTEISHSDFL